MSTRHPLIIVPFYLLLLLPREGTAQKQGRSLIDSLRKETARMHDDSDKVILYTHICELYSHINADSGILYGERGLEIAEEIGWTKGIADAKNNIGKNYKNKSDYAKALSFYMQALKINEEIGDKEETSLNLGNIGNIYYLQKEYEKARLCYEYALNIQQETGNEEKVATNFGNLANIYSHYYDTTHTDTARKRLNREKALDHYAKACLIFKKLNNKNGLARNLANAGNIYKQDKDKTLALQHYGEALALSEETGNMAVKAAGLLNISDIYLSVAKDSTGLLLIENKNSRDRKEHAAKAIRYADESAQISAEIGFLEVLQGSLSNLSEAYALLGNHQEALTFHREYAQVTDSIYRKSNAEEISKLEAQHKLAQQDKEIQIQKLEVARKRNTSLFLAIGIILLLFVVYFISKERKKSELLLLNILPAKIAKRLKKKEYPIADYFPNVSIMFIDMANFTSFSADKDPKELVGILNEIFTRFDGMAEKYGLEKIKTIGDCYMAVAGLPVPRHDHTVCAAGMAVEVMRFIREYRTADGTPVHLRIGLDEGPVVAGVIGSKKFIYDLWGDTVNTASRMESHGIIGEIHCTDNFKRILEAQRQSRERFGFVAREAMNIKGKGMMQTWIMQSVSQ